MNFLLDTHAIYWSQEEPERLGTQAIHALNSLRTRRVVSPISALEFAQLVASRKLVLKRSVSEWMKAAREYLLAEDAPFTDEIAAAAYELPAPFHRDPADRILVATARIHDLTLLTADERILNYAHVRSQDARQ